MLTYGASFIVMKDRKIDLAFTSDKHFEQAGFKKLLDAMTTARTGSAFDVSGFAHMHCGQACPTDGRSLNIFSRLCLRKTGSVGGTAAFGK